MIGTWLMGKRVCYKNTALSTEEIKCGKCPVCKGFTT